MERGNEITPLPNVSGIIATVRAIGDLLGEESADTRAAAITQACERLGKSTGAETVAVRSIGPDLLSHFVGGWATTAILDGPKRPLRVRDLETFTTPVIARSLADMPVIPPDADLKAWRSQSPYGALSLFCPVRSGAKTLGFICLVTSPETNWGPDHINAISLAAGAIGQFLLRAWQDEAAEGRIAMATFLREASHRLHRLTAPEFVTGVESVLIDFAQRLDAENISMWRINRETRSGERLIFWSATGEDPLFEQTVDVDTRPVGFNSPTEAEVIIDPQANVQYAVVPGGTSDLAEICLGFRRSGSTPWQRWEIEVMSSLADHVALARRKMAIAARLTATFEEAPRGISLRELDGTFVDCNQAYIDFLGVDSKGAAADLGLGLVVDPALNPPKVLEAVEKRAFDAVNGHELAYTRPDGSIVWGRASIVKIGEDGERLWLAHVEDVTSHRKALEVIRLRAATDPLTGTANRHTVAETLDTMLRGPAAANPTAPEMATCAAVLLDLNGFKAVNDTHGHAIGDRVLVEITDRLLASVRPTDLVGRYGGDEFVVVLPGPTSATEAIAMAQRLRECFAEPVLQGDPRIEVGASVGVAVALTDDTPDSLLARADVAMYQEKFESRIRRATLKTATTTAMYTTIADRDSPLPTAAADGLVTTDQLSEALRSGEIVFWGQPIVHLATGQPLGVELLARWPQRDGSIIAPGDFVPLAESSGLVVDLGRQALAMATRLFDRWADDQDCCHLGINVNISPLHLAHGIVDDVHAIIPALPPDAQLGLEFIETALAIGSQDHLRSLDSLVDRGVRVIIDDFGIGHSSLSRLHQFPASNLKLDKSFLADIVDNQERFRFFRSIVRMMASAGYPVTVEGVESGAQLAAVRQVPAAAVQGFHLGAPAPVEHLETELRELKHRATAANRS